MLIVTFGAEGRTVQELSDVADRHSVDLIVDVRRAPANRDREWGPMALQEKFGIRYHWSRGLAVTNMRSELASGALPRFVDVQEGLTWLGARFVRHRAWLFLGDAPDPMHDARGHLARRFQEELSGVVVLHDIPAVTSRQEGLW